jgi:hypothetical protein
MAFLSISIDICGSTEGKARLRIWGGRSSNIALTVMLNEFQKDLLEDNAWVWHNISVGPLT